MTRHGLWSLAVWLALGMPGAGDALAQAPASRTPLEVPYLVPPSAVPLDERQRAEIMTIRRELHDRLCTLSGELLHAQEEVRAQMARRPRNPESLKEAARRVSEIQGRVREAVSESQRNALALLSDEQRTALAKWRQGVRARGELEEAPYTGLPGIELDEPDIESPEDPPRKPRY